MILHEIQILPLDELRALQHEIEMLMAQRRREALEQVKQQIIVFGFMPHELACSRPVVGPIRRPRSSPPN